MEVNRVQPSFGMAVAFAVATEKETNRYISRLPYDEAIQFSLAKMDQNGKSPDVILSMVKNFWGKTRLRASVGYKNYTESFWHGPTEILQRAVNEAERVRKTQAERRELVKGMYIPKLD